MSDSLVFVRTFDAPPFSQKEYLRYMGCPNADGAVLELAESVLTEAQPLLHYRVCWRELPMECTGGTVVIDRVSVQSRHLAKALTGCSRVLLFGATLGIELDRLIAKYSRTAPSRAVALQALGAERVEALCDAFVAEQTKGYQASGVSLRPRFSPGYGDLSLELQRKLFEWLDCARKIGLSLNDSLLMSPTKSVTAVVGLCEERPVIKESL